MEDSMIPQEKSAAVTRGLREAFGLTAFEDIRKLTRGHTSSLVFRIVVRGSPFLLKIIMRTDDPTRHFTCMKAAAEAGLAPHVWYTSIEDRIAITDFVEAAPFPVTDALVRIPAALRTLHALPPFPGVLNHLNTSCMFLINKGLPWTDSSRGFRRRTFSLKVKARNSSPGTRNWLRFTRVTIRTWCRVTTICSSRTISFSTDTAYGWWTGKLLS